MKTLFPTLALVILLGAGCPQEESAPQEADQPSVPAQREDVQPQAHEESAADDPRIDERVRDLAEENPDWEFTVDIPDDWIEDYDRYTSTDVSGRDVPVVYRARNKEHEGLVDPLVQTIRVIRIPKNDRSFEEVVEEYRFAEEGRDAHVEDINPFLNEPIAPEDIAIENGETDVGGLEVPYSVWDCLEPCFLEGYPPRWTRYFYDGPGFVYFLEQDVRHAEESEPFMDGFHERFREIAESFIVLPE